MIAAVIGEEVGFVGIAGITALFAIFGFAGFRIAQTAKDTYGKLLAAGLTALVLSQAVINLFAVMGLAPLTGVPLPFVSYGNSSLLVSLVRGRPHPQRRPRRDGECRCGKAHRPRWQTPGRRWRAQTRPRVVIAAGGTAGHVVPAMAVADELRGRGAAVSFIGTRAEDRGRSGPCGAVTRSTTSRSGASTASTRCAPRPPRCVPCSRSARPGGGCRARQAEVVMGGGGFVAGPVGLAALAIAGSAGADRGRQPSRARQPPARGPGPPRLSRLPDRRPRRRSLPGHGAPGPRGGTRGRPRAARGRGSGSRPAPDACWWSVAARARASINFAALDAFAGDPGRGFEVIHLAGRRDYPELRDRLERVDAGSYDPAPLRAESGPMPGGERPRPRAAPAARCSSSPPRAAGGAGPVSARDRRSPDLQCPLDGATPARLSCSPTQSLAAASASRGRRPSRRRRAAASGCRRRPAPWPGPDAAARIADEVLAAAR